MLIHATILMVSWCVSLTADDLNICNHILLLWFYYKSLIPILNLSEKEATESRYLRSPTKAVSEYSHGCIIFSIFDSIDTCIIVPLDCIIGLFLIHFCMFMFRKTIHKIWTFLNFYRLLPYDMSSTKWNILYLADVNSKIHMASVVKYGYSLFEIVQITTILTKRVEMAWRRAGDCLRL